MKIRTSILPKGIGDVGATAFLLITLVFVYFYEMIVVLPHYYESGTFWYNLHLICGSLIFLNTFFAYAAIILCDTSIKGCVIQRTEGCTICSICESVMPPRAWHCPRCNICILKRDHHCMFTSCCIGYFNHRYFLTLLISGSIGAFYALYFNIFYVIEIVNFKSFFTFIRILLPFAMVVIDGYVDAQYSLIVFVLSFLASICASILLVYHVKLLLKGTVYPEFANNITKYNFGFQQNMCNVFGKRWRIAWISPLIPSELPEDGINFKTNETSKEK